MQAVDLDETGNTGPQFFVTSVGNVKPTNAANVTVPGYLVMFVFMSAAFTALTLAVERESGTLERLATSGAGTLAMVSGKFLASVYRGVIQVVILGLFGTLIFGMTLGETPGATVAVALLMVLASSAFGVMLASIFRTVRAAPPAAVLVSLIAAPLGGSWWPLFILSDWMRALALLTPHGWANTRHSTRLMLFGGDLESVDVRDAGACGIRGRIHRHRRLEISSLHTVKGAGCGSHPGLGCSDQSPAGV